MKGKTLLAVLVTLLSALALAAAGCGGDDEEAAPGDGEPTEISFDLKVGNLVPFTGDLSSFGEPIDQAARIAADVANEAAEEAGIDATVEIVASEDDQTDATAAVEGATKLVQTDQVGVVMGALASTNTIPVAESVTIPNRVLQISPASTSPAISDLSDNGFVWRTPPSDAKQGEVMAQAIADEIGADATVNVGTRNDAYGTALAGVFEASWKEAGGTIGQSVKWNPDAATFDTEAQQLTRGNPDAWVVIDFPETFAKVGPALVRTGRWDPGKTFATDGLRDSSLPQDVGRQATAGMRGTAPVPPEGAQAAQAFGTIFDQRAKAGVERQTFDAHAFDAVILAFLAAAAANSSDPADMLEEMQAVSGPPGDPYTFEQLGTALTALANGEEIDYQGASGPIDWDANGDPTAATYELWRFESGKIESLRNFEVGGEAE
jgi:ABC-type branched-subunit amino acid transport system substrate-binding protein